MFQDAQAFLDGVYRKFGSLRGSDYLCSESNLTEQDGRFIAHIGLIPWPYAIAAENRVDFDKLIGASGAITY